MDRTCYEMRAAEKVLPVLSRGVWFYSGRRQELQWGGVSSIQTAVIEHPYRTNKLLERQYSFLDSHKTASSTRGFQHGSQMTLVVISVAKKSEMRKKKAPEEGN